MLRAHDCFWAMLHGPLLANAGGARAAPPDPSSPDAVGSPANNAGLEEAAAVGLSVELLLIAVMRQAHRATPIVSASSVNLVIIKKDDCDFYDHNYLS
jgi:hypothetical protein